MKLSKDLVGKTIYAIPTGNAARGWDGEPKTFEVVSIGRKYFTLRRGRGTREESYSPTSGATQTAINIGYGGNSGYKFYHSVEALQMAQEEASLRDELYMQLQGWYNIPKYLNSSDVSAMLTIIKNAQERVL